MPSNRSPRSSTGRKSTLYCFNCDHESPIDGDWVVHDHDGFIDYWCPGCGTMIISRRTESDESAEGSDSIEKTFPIN